MIVKPKKLLICAVTAWLSCQNVHAELIWDELVQGDFSNSRANPTTIDFTYLTEVDSVTGTVGGSNPGEFEDVFTFDLFFGFCLDRVVLSDYVPTGGNTSTGFNLWLGNEAVDDENEDDYLGSNAAGTAQIGTDLFAGLGPFLAQAYTIEIREGIAGQLYRLDIELCQTAFAVEAFDGDFSNDLSNPTAISLTTTNNTVSGVVGGPDPGEINDAFTFTVPNGLSLSEIILMDYRPTDSNTTTGFNLYPGADATGDSIVGVALGTADIGTNVLSALLAPGQYTFLVKDTLPGQKYGLEFVFSDVIFSNDFEASNF